MKFDLEDRIIKFGAMTLSVSETLPIHPEARNLRNQLARSGTAPALSYGEARAAESGADFIHKMGVVLKELRETHNNLSIILLKKYAPDRKATEDTLVENKELIAIIASSINTAKKRAKGKPGK